MFGAWCLLISAAVLSTSVPPATAAKRGKHGNTDEHAPPIVKSSKSSKMLLLTGSSVRATSLTFEYSGKVDAHRHAVGKTGKRGKQGPASGHIWTIGGWVPADETANDFEKVTITTSITGSVKFGPLQRGSTFTLAATASNTEGGVFPEEVVLYITPTSSAPSAVIFLETSCGKGKRMQLKDIYGGALRLVAMATTGDPAATVCGPSAGPPLMAHGKGGKGYSTDAEPPPSLTTLVLQYRAVNNGTNPDTVFLESTVSSTSSRALKHGDLFTVTPDNADDGIFPAEATFQLTAAGKGGGGAVASATVDTSCTGDGIAVGAVLYTKDVEQDGYLQVVALSTSENNIAIECAGRQASAKLNGGGGDGKKGKGSKKVAKAKFKLSTSGSSLLPEDHQHRHQHGKGKGKKGSAAPAQAPPASSGLQGREPADSSRPLAKLVVQYVGPVATESMEHACANEQGVLNEDWGFSQTFVQGAPSYSSVRLLSTISHYVVSPSDSDGTFDLTDGIQAAAAAESTTFELFDATGNKLGECFFSTCCGSSLRVGDTFGFLRVVDVAWADSNDDGECGTVAGSQDTTSEVCSTIVETTVAKEGSPRFSTELTTVFDESTTVESTTVESTTQRETTTPAGDVELQPEIETTEDPAAFTTGTVEVTTDGESAALLAYCRVDLHPIDQFDQSETGCSGAKLDMVYMNASVGVSSQKCTEQKVTTAFNNGVEVTLFMTIQPAQCPEEGVPAVWRVCSWQPDASFCGSGVDCCNYVGDSLDAEKHGDLRGLSCQDFEEGDCNQFLGFDGEGPQLFAMELVRCNGETPVDPSCKQHNVGELRLSNPKMSTKLAKSGGVARSAGWSSAAALMGCGAVLLSVSLFLRRKRMHAQQPPHEDQYAAIEASRGLASREPSERIPLFKAEMSCAGLEIAAVPGVPEAFGDVAAAAAATEDGGEDDYYYPADLNRLQLLHV